MNSPSTVTVNSIMLPIAPRLTTTSFIATAESSVSRPRRAEPSSNMRSSAEYSPSSTASIDGTRSLAAMSVRKPRRPRFTPTSGTPRSAMRRAQESKVPSPPTTITRSARAGSASMGSVSSAAVREAPAVSGSMRMEMPRRCSSPASWSRTSGRLAASLLPTMATVLKAEDMAAIRA
jgi:hypothetical protein